MLLETTLTIDVCVNTDWWVLFTPPPPRVSLAIRCFPVFGVFVWVGVSSTAMWSLFFFFVTCPSLG